jgi:tripartite-type tricarboxylate transporter receptor subunit TctC
MAGVSVRIRTGRRFESAAAAFSSGTPKPILQKLGEALEKSLLQQPLIRQFETAFLNAEPMNDQQLTEAFRTELAISKKVLKDANISPLKQ